MKVLTLWIISRFDDNR